MIDELADGNALDLVCVVREARLGGLTHMLDGGANSDARCFHLSSTNNQLFFGQRQQ